MGLYWFHILNPMQHLPKQFRVHKAGGQLKVERSSRSNQLTSHFDQFRANSLDLHVPVTIGEAKGAHPIGQVVRQQAQHHSYLVGLKAMTAHAIHVESIFGFLNEVFHRPSLLVGLDNCFR